MPIQYKNTFLEFVPAVPQLKRSKTSPELTFKFPIQQKPEFDRVDSDAETECSTLESSGDSIDSPAPASQRKQLTGPLWADMTDDDDDDEELGAPVAAPAAAAEPKMSWADIESDDEQVVADVAAAVAPEEPTRASQEAKQSDQVEPAAEVDGWTTVVKKGKKSRR
jgi:hypothetical protein